MEMRSHVGFYDNTAHDNSALRQFSTVIDQRMDNLAYDNSI